MILDVGCQYRKHGDVNVDLDPYTRPDVVADARDLSMFKNHEFEVVHFHGLLHHMTHPERAWQEMVRVARDLVYGIEPTNFNPRAYTDPTHVFHGFNRGQLKAICHYPVEGVLDIRYSLTLPFSPIFTITKFVRDLVVPKSLQPSRSETCR